MKKHKKRNKKIKSNNESSCLCTIKENCHVCNIYHKDNDSSMAISSSFKEDLELEKRNNECSMFSHWLEDMED